jgi:hypothetical protein
LSLGSVAIQKSRVYLAFVGMKKRRAKATCR